MTDKMLQSLVTEAISLDREISEAQDRLKEIKGALIVEAESREDEHQTTDGGGSTWTATSNDGSIARVTFPAAKLKSSISGEGAAIEKVRAAAGPHFSRLFTPAINHKPVEGFREQAASLLGKAASKLIKLCETASSASVAFETKEKA